MSWANFSSAQLVVYTDTEILSLIPTQAREVIKLRRAEIHTVLPIPTRYLLLRHNLDIQSLIWIEISDIAPMSRACEAFRSLKNSPDRYEHKTTRHDCSYWGVVFRIVRFFALLLTNPCPENLLRFFEFSSAPTPPSTLICIMYHSWIYESLTFFFLLFFKSQGTSGSFLICTRGACSFLDCK